MAKSDESENIFLNGIEIKSQIENGSPYLEKNRKKKNVGIVIRIHIQLLLFNVRHTCIWMVNALVASKTCMCDE